MCSTWEEVAFFMIFSGVNSSSLAWENNAAPRKASRYDWHYQVKHFYILVMVDSRRSPLSWEFTYYAFTLKSTILVIIRAVNLFENIQQVVRNPNMHWYLNIQFTRKGKKQWLEWKFSFKLRVSGLRTLNFFTSKSNSYDFVGATLFKNWPDVSQMTAKKRVTLENKKIRK